MIDFDIATISDEDLCEAGRRLQSARTVINEKERRDALVVA